MYCHFVMKQVLVNKCHKPGQETKQKRKEVIREGVSNKFPIPLKWGVKMQLEL